MDSDVKSAVAAALMPVNQKIFALERKVAELEKLVKAQEKSFSDLVRQLDPRNR